MASSSPGSLSFMELQSKDAISKKVSSGFSRILDRIFWELLLKVGNKIMLNKFSNPFCVFLVNSLSTDSPNILWMSEDNGTVFFRHYKQEFIYQ